MVGRPTIKDVALAAGVSHTTVSYVLGGSPHAARISEETRRRVWEAAGRLGYLSNPVGRALRRGYTDTVVLLVVTWQVARSHAQTAMAVSRAAGARGLQLTVHVAQGDREALAFLKRASLHNIMGLLVLWDSPEMQNSGLVQLANDGLPVVDLLPGDLKGVVSVTTNREDAGYRVARHLLDLGHRRIAFVGDMEQRMKTTGQKLAGYRRALEECEVGYDPALVESVAEFGFEGGASGMASLLVRCPELTAVFCINDPMALGAIAFARSSGRRCPECISAAGYGAFDEGAYWRPSLTTVGLSAERVAAAAIDQVVRYHQGLGTKPESLAIPGDLITRESTGPAPA